MHEDLILTSAGNVLSHLGSVLASSTTRPSGLMRSRVQAQKDMLRGVWVAWPNTEMRVHDQMWPSNLSLP